MLCREIRGRENVIGVTCLKWKASQSYAGPAGEMLGGLRWVQLSTTRVASDSGGNPRCSKPTVQLHCWVQLSSVLADRGCGPRREETEDPQLKPGRGLPTSAKSIIT